ncbi:N-acetylglucosamine-6-phosphate deacetylase [Candidatus Binatus sp.]|jgi:N-acetylglucosamine-6-phosphate deacetylase|uniref:N-acetylglucosamine-6-phosphate deacetylase n=1 Tax=Candidatus Binatus sp. TaxID=2811406 RepID=UPI002FD8B638
MPPPTSMNPPAAMLSGCIARPDGSLIRGRITFTDRITALESASDGGGEDYILPGFVDLQVNGSHGIDVMNAAPDALATLSRHLAREGATAWMPTAVTAPIEKIAQVHESIAGAIENSRRDNSADAAAILGMHLEGPFISPLRLGAHPALNLEPRGDSFQRVLAMRALRLITLAPELPGGFDAIRRLAARAVVVSIGHTNATLEEANAGIAAGARMFTHLFNAMRPLNHRDPGVIAAALAPSPALAAIIPDGVHVHPAVLRLASRARGKDGMILVTDKVALAKASTSEKNVGRARGSIRDGAARLDDGTLAGSIISMLDGVRVMVERAGVSIGDAAVMAATNPANLVGAGDRGRIQIGARADLIVLSRTLELKSVFIAGREIS